MSMANPATFHPAIHRGHTGFLQSFAVAYRRFAEWQDARSAMRQLSHMSDAALKDIGITRNEIAGTVLRGRTENLSVTPHEGAFR
jgi:uncharacterized protein YjiS (DUF1127 family)